MSFKQLAAGTTLLGIALILSVCLLTPQTLPAWDEAPVLLALAALYAFTEFFPLQRHQISISLSLSVDLVLFMKFGLLPLLLINQFFIFMGRAKRVGKFEFWPSVANGGMFLVVNSGAYAVYQLAGGAKATSILDQIGPLAAFVGSHMLINHLLLYVYVKKMSGTRVLDYLPSMRFDIFSTLFAAALGFILTLLYEVDGLIGLLAFGVPMVLSVYVFRLFNDLSRSSTLFRNLANLTGSFSGELDVEVMSTRVTQDLTKWFDRSTCAIFVQQGSSPRLLSAAQECSPELIEAFQAFIERRRAAHRTTPLLVKRASAMPEFKHTPYRALLLAPLLGDGAETMGYCCLLTHRAIDLDPTAVDAVSILANQLSVSFRTAMRYENVEKQSLYDGLTQLPNQRFCERRLEELLNRPGNRPLSLLLIDLDHFKQINDRWGHLAGNCVLQAVARLFESCVRPGDFVARYGGEEFLVVLPDAAEAAAAEIAEQIRHGVERMQVDVPTMDGERVPVRLTVSIGVATSSAGAHDAQHLIRYADRAMYIGAKRAGRNRVARYQREPYEEDLPPTL